MAAKKAHTHEVDVVDKVRGFWAVYNKPISYIGSTIVILFIGWIGSCEGNISFSLGLLSIPHDLHEAMHAGDI